MHVYIFPEVSPQPLSYLWLNTRQYHLFLLSNVYKIREDQSQSSSAVSSYFLLFSSVRVFWKYSYFQAVFSLRKDWVVWWHKIGHSPTQLPIWPVLLDKMKSWGVWVVQSIKCLTLDFGSWSQDFKIEPHIGLHTGHGACLRFCLPHPLPLPHLKKK